MSPAAMRSTTVAPASDGTQRGLDSDIESVSVNGSAQRRCCVSESASREAPAKGGRKGHHREGLIHDKSAATPSSQTLSGRTSAKQDGGTADSGSNESRGQREGKGEEAGARQDAHQADDG